MCEYQLVDDCISWCKQIFYREVGGGGLICEYQLVDSVSFHITVSTSLAQGQFVS